MYRWRSWFWGFQVFSGCSRFLRVRAFGLVRFCSAALGLFGAVGGQFCGRNFSGALNWADVQCFAGDRAIWVGSFARFCGGFVGFWRGCWVILDGSAIGAGATRKTLGRGHRGLLSCSVLSSTSVLTRRWAVKRAPTESGLANTPHLPNGRNHANI